MTLTPLDIPRRSPSCGQCTKKLSCEEFYYSQLENTTRKDFCKDCWEQKPPSPAYFWKARPPKMQSSSPIIEKEARALNYLKDIAGTETAIEEQFFLALYLARKKILAFKKEFIEQGTTYQLFEIVATAEVLYVRKVNIHTVNASEIQAQLAKILSA